jgi:hypothetical protein
MDLIIAEVPRNLPVPHVLDLVSSIPNWNVRVDNYVVSIFGFADKYLVRMDSSFFFYDNDF